ncbi:MAG TPA: multifunctional oxoglutarate decarboxylase/oxoglutarate dehydrogenase thiamine pyrophosphate-binding subunit/dihydrolipoyllysine-residue succinyltransferase subunit [Bryobacteraceae bacterium]|nr:multifunctional oxoglutarate decarboxylase/oxoglutarate dehydrogenase thiamine pyrophosphate-binding subunit/dihydrolipoyllysine-residue succinyltransferase subunit [Bryobacteraceae bacterium]
MSDSTKIDVNSWLEEELYQQYLHNHSFVDSSWQSEFAAPAQTNGGPAPAATATAVAEPVAAPPAPPATPDPIPTPAAPVVPTAATPAAPPPAAAPTNQQVTKPESSIQTQQGSKDVGSSEQLVPLRGTAARIAENMILSLSVPTATSQRAIPVKVIDENRRIINQHRTLLGLSKISYTHLIGWAIVKALDTNPALNSSYTENNGEAFKVVRASVNLGLAIDLPSRDGGRSLVVPSIKNANAMTFSDFLKAYDDLINRGRKGKLTLPDFQGTTLSLTNPGTLGTVGSIPRLMPGQGCIIATGAMDFPAEYQGVAPEMRAMLGIGKVMTVTCTYDHRIIQGAESGMFLAKLQGLLQGEDRFYDDIFANLRMPHMPVKWEADRAVAPRQNAMRQVEISKESSILQLINAYRVRGHLIADLDPLGSEPNHFHPELDPAHYGLTIWDLDREYVTGSLGQAIGEGAAHMVLTLREILETLRQTYCGKVGTEYMYIQSPEQKTWLQQRMETNRYALATPDRQRILERLHEAEGFESFLGTRFVGTKRFGLEGGESAIAICDEICERAADGAVHEIVIGMAHRGRLNVLTNIIGKKPEQILSEFEGNPTEGTTQGSGDVKYHLGATGVRRAASAREIVVSLAPNPSHLEAVNPVVEGIVRPKQDRLGDLKRERVIPLLIHGDAAFAGQGVVAETLNMSQLDGYTTGGTIHLVINNQIGFTTRPDDSRSSIYATDIARAVDAPIFHVNGDDPEACVHVARFAYEFRQRFKKDVVIDMICYRRHGHNEADDPSYTQPIMYRKIKSHPSVATLYAERLVREKVVTQEDVDRIRKSINQRLSDAHARAQQNASQFEYQELAVVDEVDVRREIPQTAADPATLQRVIHGSTSFPDDFHVHPKLKKFLDSRRAILEGETMDWAAAEALAFGSLVLDGTPVRLSGQDCGRGTFSQRHLVFHDSESGEPYIPLQHLAGNQARFEVWDSSLSEYAVMGFEFGYSVADPLSLVLWEGQFGDFANGAQIMIDQFISCSYSKWGQPSGLVLLLPHGQEGQGPEHSSARLERFLTLCAEENMQVVNPTTPAQYFHLLRRQMHGGADRRGMRRPLIVMTPKSLLRHAKATSTLNELTSGGFREIIGDGYMTAADEIKRVLLTSGKIYYELLDQREKSGAKNVAIIRIEQYYPFPKAELQDVLMRYPVTAEVCWVQEEPLNMGAWRFVREQIQPILDPARRSLRYIGRAASASPAPGSLKRHQSEQAEILADSFNMDATPRAKTRLVVRRKS